MTTKKSQAPLAAEPPEGQSQAMEGSPSMEATTLQQAKRGRPSALPEGVLISQWFAKSGLTRAELAKKLGIHVNHASKLLRGERRPSGPLRALIEHVSGGEVPANSWRD